MNNFSELSLSSPLRINLTKLGFSEPTPVQAQAIPAALEGRDVVATAQTGTGKTLAFLLPLLESLSARKGNGPAPSHVEAVILSPTRELAIQIDETFARLAPGTGFRSAVVVGGLSESTQLRAIRKGAQVLIATPGRLQDFLTRGLVSLRNIKVFVLDEADRMLDMGFLPAIRQILQSVPDERQTLLFSATLEKSVQHLIESHVKNPVRVAIGAVTRPVEQVDLHLYEVEQDRKLGLLTKLLAKEKGSFLVFARTKHGADRLAKKLDHAGVRSARIHGDRTQSQRNQALAGFKNGSFRVLVATDVAARGIHVEGIAHVVNYDLPQAPEDFIHRVGRTGRAGARGVASTFHTRQERSEVKRIEREIGVPLVRQDTPAIEATAAPKQAAPAPKQAAPAPKQEAAQPPRTEHAKPKVIVMPAAKAKKPFYRSAPKRRRAI